jgi:chemotaxis protein MotB
VNTLSGSCRIPEQILHQAPLKKKGTPVRLQKRSIPAETGNEIWLLTLSDLLMLLLIFFVLLFAVILHQQRPAVATPSPSSPPKPAVETPPAITHPPSPEAVPDRPPSPKATVSLESDLAGLVREDRAAPGVTVESRSHAIIMTFPERIMFDSGRSQLKGAVDPLLEKVALFILDHPDVSIEIHGHTDDLPISNQRFPSNWELSADRATQVAKALVRLGTDPSRLSVRGFGEYRPLVANDSDLNRLKNRRVEIQFSHLPAQP